MTVIKFPSLYAAVSTAVRDLALEDSILGWVPDALAVDEEGAFVADESCWLHMEAFFVRYGFRIERHGSWNGYREGLLYLGDAITTNIRYLREFPDHYKMFTEDWTTGEHEYVRAVESADLEEAYRLAPRTRFSLILEDKMQGCTLKRG